MNVVFVEPAFPHYQREFVRALQATGHRVVGIGERPLAALGGELQHWLTHYEQVRSVVDEAALLDTVRGLQRRLWIDRLEATVEAHILPVAKVREKCGIPGTTIRTAWLCRDKPSMKEALRAAGIPCAQSASVANAPACSAPWTAPRRSTAASTTPSASSWRERSRCHLSTRSSG